MHTFACSVGLPYSLICEHDIICVYVYTNEIDVISRNSVPTWGNKYHCYIPCHIRITYIVSSDIFAQYSCTAAEVEI